MGLKDYVLNTYIKDIIYEENGNKYIDEADYEKINADEQERVFILQVIKSENITIKHKEYETDKKCMGLYGHSSCLDGLYTQECASRDR